ncbi:hypothetical protein K438DRAFT_1770120 [Mycena galopus ATCC 62051]|nr:hypothetical protein K438DRAFT_1770120 [Mycena galopus ATCC 62051]
MSAVIYRFMTVSAAVCGDDVGFPKAPLRLEAGVNTTAQMRLISTQDLVLWFKKNPYADIPYEWNHEDRDDKSKSELQFGSNYILPNIDSDTESIAKLVPAPSITGGKPKPVKRSYGEVDDMDDAAIKRAAKRGKKCIPKPTPVGARRRP